MELFMDLKEYFESNEGVGVLATGDDIGKINTALYSRPNFIEDGKIAFIMPERLTQANLAANPQASYLFIQKTGRYQGKRLHLTLVDAEKNSPRIKELKRSTHGDPAENHWLMVFKVDKVLPLVGPGNDSDCN
jgi:hypothetical protein